MSLIRRHTPLVRPVGCDYSAGPQLISVDQATLIGAIDLAGLDFVICEGLEFFNPADGLFYGATGTAVDFLSNRLLTIDPEIGIVTQVAQITGTVDIEADALVFINGTLHAIDSTG